MSGCFTAFLLTLKSIRQTSYELGDLMDPTYYYYYRDRTRSTWRYRESNRDRQREREKSIMSWQCTKQWKNYVSCFSYGK